MPATFRAQDRVAGLDLLRAIAIAGVVVAHYPKRASGLIVRAENFGWTGVDLFFVLSGFLIASQLFKELSRDNKVNISRFYLRRFLRTLPSYYAVLTVYFLLSPAVNWRYLTFTQNLSGITTFAPSWSLCVEEQFYILFPLLVILIQVRWWTWVAPVIVIVSVLLRAIIWLKVQPNSLSEPNALFGYMDSLYYPTYCRLDGIALGVALGAIKNSAPHRWKSLSENVNRLLFLGLLLIGCSAVLLWNRYTFWGSVLGFTVISLGFACFVAVGSNDTVVLSRWKPPGVRFLAVLSYAVYLTHSLAFLVASRIVGDLDTIKGVVTTSALVLAFAGVLFLTVERPALALRDRLLDNDNSSASVCSGPRNERLSEWNSGDSGRPVVSIAHDS